MEPKYKVNPLTGELQEYGFEYNGILALRNFTARVEDERLILHAADDVNFSILEALVSEVEINGVVYDNPTAAQEALTRLTFNQNRPVLLDKSLKDLILGAVQKIPGKKLSTEDFTTELRQKLEGLQQVDTSGLLPKGGYTGTAQDLKNLIDAINRILQSDDTQLDQLQEIVTYIKQNKHILSTLGISNIAGLVEALAAKAEKDHHHDERYAPITHHHNEYALRTHRHNWDDIDGKPNNLATTDNVKTAIEGIQVGGRNLFIKSNDFSTSNDWKYQYGRIVDTNVQGINNTNTATRLYLSGRNWDIHKPFSFDELTEYTLSCWIKLETVSNVVFYLNNAQSWENSLAVLNVTGNLDEWKKVVITFKPKSNLKMNFHIGGNGIIFQSEGNILICNLKLEKGNKPTDWSPAPEDLANHEDVIQKVSRVGAAISSNWTAVVEHQNNTIFVENSLNIELNQLQNMGSISFIKTFDTGAVTFTCAGKNIIYPFDNTFNGKKGSTAVVSIHNNDYYIRISNV
ncbi:hypothetical protein [Capnocytophaga leadbetteri]